MNALKLTFVALALTLAPGAWAGHCPMDMQKIDQALAQNPSLSPAQLDEVQQLRAEGQRLHEAGDHPASEAALARAMGILGIQ